FRPVEFRKLTQLAAFRRPLHREHIAAEIARVPIAFNCEHDYELAAWLPRLAKRSASAPWLVTSLLRKLTLCSRQWCFALGNEPLRDRPGSIILSGPERTPRVSEQNLETFPGFAKQKKPCADIPRCSPARHGYLSSIHAGA